MRARALGFVLLSWLLAGCEPVHVGLNVRSVNRVDAEIVATVSAADRDLTVAALQRLAPGEWRINEIPRDEVVRIEARRVFDTKVNPEIKVNHAVGPFPWVREAYTVTGDFELPPLAADHLLNKVLADVALRIEVAMPGGVTEAQGGQVERENAVFTAKLADVVGKKLAFSARAVGWRQTAVIAWLVVLAVMTWVLWPWIMPPPEVRARRREAAAARAAKRREATAARTAATEAKAASRAEANERRAAQKAAADEKKAARAAATEAKAAAKAAARAQRESAKQAKESQAASEATQVVEQAQAVAEPQPQAKRRLFGKRAKTEPEVAAAAENVPVAAPEPEPVAEPTVEPDEVAEAEPAAPTIEVEPPTGEGDQAD